MSLEQSIQEVTFNREATPCPLGKIIAVLSKEDQMALGNAVMKGVPDTTLANALRKEGYKIAEISISRHRRHLCRCEASK